MRRFKAPRGRSGAGRNGAASAPAPRPGSFRERAVRDHWIDLAARAMSVSARIQPHGADRAPPLPSVVEAHLDRQPVDELFPRPAPRVPSALATRPRASATSPRVAAPCANKRCRVERRSRCCATTPLAKRICSTRTDSRSGERPDTEGLSEASSLLSRVCRLLQDRINKSTSFCPMVTSLPNSNRKKLRTRRWRFTLRQGLAQGDYGTHIRVTCHCSPCPLSRASEGQSRCLRARCSR